MGVSIFLLKFLLHLFICVCLCARATKWDQKTARGCQFSRSPMCVLFLSLVAFTHWTAFLCTWSTSQSLVLQHPRSSSWVLCHLYLGEWELCLLWFLRAFIAETELCTWIQFSQTQGSGLPSSVIQEKEHGLWCGFTVGSALPQQSLIHYSVWFSTPYRMDSQCGQQGGFWWLQYTSHLQEEWFHSLCAQLPVSSMLCSVVWRTGLTSLPHNPLPSWTVRAEVSACTPSPQDSQPWTLQSHQQAVWPWPCFFVSLSFFELESRLCHHCTGFSSLQDHLLLCVPFSGLYQHPWSREGSLNWVFTAATTTKEWLACMGSTQR